jgi:hypothetical protein
MSEELHAIARERAEQIASPDRKQLRFNDIVSTAVQFYNDPAVGVRELVDACDKDCALYVKGAPMWQTLRADYGWMSGY